MYLKRWMLSHKLKLYNILQANAAVELIEKMDKDDAVDLLEALLNQDEEQAKTILGKMDPGDQLELNPCWHMKNIQLGH